MIFAIKDWIRLVKHDKGKLTLLIIINIHHGCKDISKPMKPNKFTIIIDINQKIRYGEDKKNKVHQVCFHMKPFNLSYAVALLSRPR